MKENRVVCLGVWDSAGRGSFWYGGSAQGGGCALVDDAATAGVGTAGRVTLSLVGGSGRDFALTFDPSDSSLAVATFEKIPLKDEDLKRIWSAHLYRVLVTSVAPTDGGTWKMEIV